MKVTTEACVFGAWIAEEIPNLIKEETATMLDIGGGTGLLSMMVAQKINRLIDIIEIDESACEQANENVRQSKWRDRIKIINGDVRELNRNSNYDLIFSNPPFYDNSLKSPSSAINLARHASQLSLPELIQSANKLLRADAGFFCLLVPQHRLKDLMQIAHINKLYLCRRASIHQTEAHTAFREMVIFSRQITESFHETIVIKENGMYSQRLSALLKDYYLAL